MFSSGIHIQSTLYISNSQGTGQKVRDNELVVTPLELMGPRVLFELEQSSRYRVFEISRVDCLILVILLQFLQILLRRTRVFINRASVCGEAFVIGSHINRKEAEETDWCPLLLLFVKATNKGEHEVTRKILCLDVINS